MPVSNYSSYFVIVDGELHSAHRLKRAADREARKVDGAIGVRPVVPRGFPDLEYEIGDEVYIEDDGSVFHGRDPRF